MGHFRAGPARKARCRHHARACPPPADAVSAAHPCPPMLHPPAMLAAPGAPQAELGGPARHRDLVEPPAARDLVRSRPPLRSVEERSLGSATDGGGEELGGAAPVTGRGRAAEGGGAGAEGGSRSGGHQCEGGRRRLGQVERLSGVGVGGGGEERERRWR